MSTPRLTTIPTDKRGRPQSIHRKAESLIGTAGVSALNNNDLYIVSGAIIRELGLLIQEPLPAQLANEKPTNSEPVVKA